MKCKEKDKYAKMEYSLSRMRHIMALWLKERGLTKELRELLIEAAKDEEIEFLRRIIRSQAVYMKSKVVINDGICNFTVYNDDDDLKKLLLEFSRTRGGMLL